MQLAKVDEVPDVLVGCTGGASNFGGLAFPFLREKMAGKADAEVFGKLGKKAIKQFYSDIYAIGDDTVHAIDAIAYAEALRFFKAFKSEGSAKLVRESA